MQFLPVSPKLSGCFSAVCMNGVLSLPLILSDENFALQLGGIFAILNLRIQALTLYLTIQIFI